MQTAWVLIDGPRAMTSLTAPDAGLHKAVPGQRPSSDGLLLHGVTWAVMVVLAPAAMPSAGRLSSHSAMLITAFLAASSTSMEASPATCIVARVMG